MFNRLNFLPKAQSRDSIIFEGRRHIANQQNSLRLVSNTGDGDMDNNNKDNEHKNYKKEISHELSDEIKLPEIKRAVVETSTHFSSVSDAVSKILYELKYISLSIRAVQYRKIEIANTIIYYNICDRIYARTSPPGFFLIPPSTILSALKFIPVTHKLNVDGPMLLKRLPENLISTLKSHESNILLSVRSVDDINNIESMCDIIVKKFLQSNQSNFNIELTDEYTFFKARLKFKAIQNIFEKKFHKLIPSPCELNINVIEAFLLHPECKFLSWKNCLSYFQSKCQIPGQLYPYSALSLSWRILGLVFTLMLLNEKREIDDHLRPNDPYVMQRFTNRNIKKFINKELYIYNGETTAPCFYRSLWSLVSTHNSISASIQSSPPSINISNPCTDCANVDFAFSNSLQLIIQQILPRDWTNIFDIVTEKTSSCLKTSSNCTATCIKSVDDFRQHSLQHIEKLCLTDDWFISLWKHKELNNYLIAVNSLVNDLMKLPKAQYMNTVNAVAIRGTKRALRGLSSYHIWANNVEIDSDLVFAQYFLLFNQPLVLNMVSLELNELQWKKKLRIDIHENDIFELHKACPVAWLCLPANEFQTQLIKNLSDMKSNIFEITFNSSGVFDKLIQSNDVSPKQKLEKMQLTLPNVAPSLLDRYLYYASQRIQDNLS